MIKIAKPRKDKEGPVMLEKIYKRLGWVLIWVFLTFLMVASL